MLLIWLDMRLKLRLSVSSSEKRSRRFMSNLGTGRLDWVNMLFAGKPVISVSERASTSDVE
jgi:hypothetical protein